MKILAIDSTSAAASAAVAQDGRLLGEIYTDFKLKHSEKLLPMIDHLLCDLRLTLSEIDCYAACCGPGSFTGLRIGAAAVKALAHGTDKEIISVSSLEACAYGQLPYEGYVCSIFDARRDELYSSCFYLSGGKTVRLSEDAVCSLEGAASCVPEGEKILFCGDGILVFKEAIEEMYEDRALFCSPASVYPRASAAALLACGRFAEEAKYSYSEYMPAYLRAVHARKTDGTDG